MGLLGNRHSFFHTPPTPLMERLFPIAYHRILLIASLFFPFNNGYSSSILFKSFAIFEKTDPISRKLFQKDVSLY